jgi:hypothetical protein
MASKEPLLCEHCGSPLRSLDEPCNLCGTLAEASPEESVAAAPTFACPVCGEDHSATARFCAGCGAELATGRKPAAAAPKKPVPVWALVAGCVALVAVLFFVGRSGPGATLRTPGDATAAAAEENEHMLDHVAAGVPEAFAPQVDALREEIALLEGADRLARQRELVNLFVGIGRPDLAAMEQEEVARVDGTVDSWTRAGNLYYDWIDGVDGAHRVAVARRAIAAYKKVLEHDPENLDVRVNMAVAYLYDPEDPMEAINNNNFVLERDPSHIPANFNRGLMLLQINRMSEGVAQMEKVKQLAGEGTPFYRQAQQVIDAVNEAGRR